MNVVSEQKLEKNISGTVKSFVSQCFLFLKFSKKQFKTV